MRHWLSRFLPFAGRTQPSNAFARHFQSIAAHAVSAAELLSDFLGSASGDALARITEIEHRADECVHEIQRLVDHTFITPYDKRDIIFLSHSLDDIVDTLRSAARQIAGYRVLESASSARLAPLARALCGLIVRSAIRLKQTVDEMPGFDHDGIRDAARCVTAIEDEADELYADALRTLFPEPDQPMTAAMLGWRDVFRLLEKTTDQCEHAMLAIVSIARQEGK